MFLLFDCLFMSFDFSKWISKYDAVAPDEKIEYRDSSGNLKEEKDPKLGSISQALQQRGYLLREELRQIGRWKAGGRIDHHLKKNNQSFVERRSKVAFQSSADEDKVNALTELKGVRIPVASTILTMAEPTRYAVLDYRAFRALGAAIPQLLNPQNYDQYIEFMDSFQDYGTEPSAYSFYLNHVRNIAQKEGITPREVDMALWAFDKHRT